MLTALRPRESVLPGDPTAKGNLIDHFTSAEHPLVT